MRALRTGVLLVGVLAAASSPGGALAEVSRPTTTPAKAYGPDFSLPAPQPGHPDAAAGGGISEYDLSVGCIVGGTTGTALSISAGGMNVVNLIAGGLVPAASPVAMWVALGGVVFASFCSVGQALTPAAMASYNYFVTPATPASEAGPSLDARYCQAAQPLSRRAPADLPRTVQVGLSPERM